jgi:hypothetical protein
VKNEIEEGMKEKTCTSALSRRNQTSGIKITAEMREERKTLKKYTI